MSAPNKANSQKTPSEKISREIIEKSIGDIDSEGDKEFEIIEGAFQGTKHMTTNLIINGTLDLDVKVLEQFKEYSITGPEKLTNGKWTNKNVSK